MAAVLALLIVELYFREFQAFMRTKCELRFLYLEVRLSGIIHERVGTNSQFPARLPFHKY